MATDLAEFLGAALGFNLLFGIPLFAAGVLTGVCSFAILALQARGARPLEIAITMFVGVILVGFAVQFVLADPSARGIAEGLGVPRFDGTESVLLATGILGATVMPHVIYLHSALTQRRVLGRSESERRRIFHFERIDVVIAMSIAGVINLSMLVMAAAVFHSRGLTGVKDIDEVFDRLGDLVGPHAQIAFGVALLASGLSSSSVGTLAGQVVMQGFIRAADPGVRAAGDHDGAGAHRPGDRRQPQPRAGPEPGGAVVRDPVRPDPAAALLPGPEADGRPGQPPLHDDGRHGRDRPDRGAQPLPDRPDGRAVISESGSCVDLYWLPLGAGGRSVRLNGRVFEAVAARLDRRPPCDLYHSALVVRVPEGRFVIEMAPVPDAHGAARGVVAEGAVGSRRAGRFRIFRYEVRRWPGGVIPDLAEAVESPRRLTDDAGLARRLLDLVAADPDAGLGARRAPRRRDVELQLAERMADRPVRPLPGLGSAPAGRPRPGLACRPGGGEPWTLVS